MNVITVIRYILEVIGLWVIVWFVYISYDELQKILREERARKENKDESQRHGHC